MNCACGKSLYWGNKSGKCRTCLHADPAFLERRREAIKASWTPDARARQGAHLSAVKLAHIPALYRDQYRELRRNEYYSTSEAAEVIALMAERDQRGFSA